MPPVSVAASPSGGAGLSRPGAESELANLATLGLDAPMPEPYADTLATVAAGRTAAVADMGPLATRLEALPLESVAEVLILLERGGSDVRAARRAGT
jgi:hypothetical protein